MSQKLQNPTKKDAHNYHCTAQVEVLSVLSHPNVIGYFDSKVEDKALIISMEYASGGTLADYLQRQTSPLPESEVSATWTCIIYYYLIIYNDNIISLYILTHLVVSLLYRL